MRSSCWLVMALLVACGGGGKKIAEDLGAPDLSVSVDMAGGAIGAACTADSDCHEGPSPSCFKATLFNETGKLKTKGGYCSSSCSVDTDCNNGICIKYSDQPNGWCFADCDDENIDCRDGYACFRGTQPYCFPNGNLNCDPTAGDGTCNDAPNSNPGGCLRAAYGDGNTGYCTDGCEAGEGTCPPTNGSDRQCIVYNQKSEADNEGTVLGDKFHGGVCIYNYSSNADGVECASKGSDGNTHDYIDACADGEECWLTSAFHGDNRCHKMCDLGVDAGAGCVAPETCQDVFGLGSTSNPIGLCHM